MKDCVVVLSRRMFFFLFCLCYFLFLRLLITWSSDFHASLLVQFLRNSSLGRGIRVFTSLTDLCVSALPLLVQPGSGIKLTRDPGYRPRCTPSWRVYLGSSSRGERKEQKTKYCQIPSPDTPITGAAAATTNPPQEKPQKNSQLTHACPRVPPPQTKTCLKNGKMGEKKHVPSSVGCVGRAASRVNGNRGQRPKEKRDTHLYTSRPLWETARSSS